MCYPAGPLDECEARRRDLDRDISLDTVGFYVMVGSVAMNEVTQRRAREQSPGEQTHVRDGLGNSHSRTSSEVTE